jgi:SNF2 family DNA or RNA helicase
LPKLDPAAALAVGVRTTLLDHQLEGIGWMLQQEQALTTIHCTDTDSTGNRLSLPPLWEKFNETIPIPHSQHLPTNVPADMRNMIQQVQFGYKHTLTDVVVRQQPKWLLGGILADDMGVGKTVQMLAVILSNRPKSPNANGSISATGQASHEDSKTRERPPEEDIPRPAADFVPNQSVKADVPLKKANDSLSEIADSVDVGHNAENWKERSKSGDLRERGGTLVVCPLSVLSSWDDQVRQQACLKCVLVVTGINRR